MFIDNNTTTKELENTFISDFPYLKIKFYKKGHEHFHGSPKNEEIKEEKKLSDLNPDLSLGELNWDKTMSVDRLETILEEEFGLHIQVFRKSGDQWLQTSTTDHWTLEKQNLKALESESLATK
ncbi:MAG: hypothetical protein ACJA1A_003194 [Saprospiraceae bacterium]|jgi:hypothetical protein|tara:strand:+ start:1580 stop:1948 length:369 start_codon:yes stop_codon:yes gene_type:complete